MKNANASRGAPQTLTGGSGSAVLLPRRGTQSLAPRRSVAHVAHKPPAARRRRGARKAPAFVSPQTNFVAKIIAATWSDATTVEIPYARY